MDLIRSTPILNEQERASVIDAIRHDMSLKEDEKQRLLAQSQQSYFWQNLLQGGAGAAVGYALAKFLKMSKSAQLLMSMAGFGIGNILLGKSNDSEFTRTNPKYNVMEIK